jgi:hypothetical protein
MLGGPLSFATAADAAQRITAAVRAIFDLVIMAATPVASI